MAFQVRTEQQRTTTGLDGTIYILEDASAGVRAAVWPSLGFNCFQWQARHAGKPLDLLYCDPQFFDNGRPTRSGIPILFPFPNRIRTGRFVWEGQEYQLPLNDSTQKNAIHGFPCRKPWRVVGQGADERQAWLTAEFQGSRDAPEARSFWPADYVLRVTHRLTPGALRVEAVVENPDRTSLPFGLGYHPYFKVPLTVAGKAEDCVVQSSARAAWELDDSLPTGNRQPVPGALRLHAGKPFAELNADAVLTDLASITQPDRAGLYEQGRVREQSQGVELRLRAATAFRDLVVFTPPHRQAVCLEPYTCPTDAINLQQRGIDAGLLVLQPGEKWSGIVEMAISS